MLFRYKNGWAQLRFLHMCFIRLQFIEKTQLCFVQLYRKTQSKAHMRFLKKIPRKYRVQSPVAFCQKNKIKTLKTQVLKIQVQFKKKNCGKLRGPPRKSQTHP